MLADLLPAAVATAEALADPPEVVLYPEEERLIRSSVAKRRDEFSTVRWCARRAMAQLGLPPAPVLPGHRGAPRWAPAVVGSLTHCTGFRGAALARDEDYASLGIDAEPNAPLPEGILSSISLPQEEHWVRRLLAERPEVCWDRLLFSMKEAVYKTWFPYVGRELDFGDALITTDPDSGRFRAEILLGSGERMAGDPREFYGRWLARDGLLLSAIALPAMAPAGLRPAHGSAPRGVAATGSALGIR
ncbi:4'-phosphopantetheinyl transferase superfamily protein [Kitasatospora sp. NBC_01287]|uniref:4'-phosphopantetheinyl transferase family protein n=1 Tax=Kitasatospora sp. NBC_01287 TaxID=2903573 RepID=UPI0022593EAC|nr:4'-phosphopantetheinyl transferase superfamily protein [Kitasatospora sp. NBC_01287]MCX4750339.1 4'-phosphopantetheinyl transferase superfamily protein [Kitasatospora sp. NBC_01287]